MENSNVLPFLAMIFEVNPDNIIFLWDWMQNNGFKWEENQIYYFYLSKDDPSRKSENIISEKCRLVWAKLMSFSESTPQNYHEKNTLIKTARWALFCGSV